MANQEFDWIKRRQDRRLRQLALNILWREKKLAPECFEGHEVGERWMTNDAEMFLRMGYDANELALMTCSDEGVAVSRLYPCNALLLTGRAIG